MLIFYLIIIIIIIIFLQYTLSQTTVEQLKEPIFNIWHWEPNEVSCRMHIYPMQVEIPMCKTQDSTRSSKLLNIAMYISRIRLTTY